MVHTMEYFLLTPITCVPTSKKKRPFRLYINLVTMVQFAICSAFQLYESVFWCAINVLKLIHFALCYLQWSNKILIVRPG